MLWGVATLLDDFTCKFVSLNVAPGGEILQSSEII